MHGAIDPLFLGAAAATAAAGALYVVGIVRLWRSAGAGRGVRRRHAAAFGVALTAGLASVSQPLDGWADTSMLAHMAQHLILLVVVPVGIVAGRPVVAFAWALRLRRRSMLTRVAQAGRGGLAQPAVAAGLVALHVAVVWIWHVPVFYDAAVSHESIHVAEHVSFVVTAAVFWWLVVPTVHPAGSRVLVALAATVLVAAAGTALAIVLAFSTSQWYASAGGRWLSPVDDQQAAGALMGIVGAVAYGTTAAILVWRLLDLSQRQDVRAGRQRQGRGRSFARAGRSRRPRHDGADDVDVDDPAEALALAAQNRRA